MILKELINQDILRMAVLFSAPLLIAAIGQLITNRCGILNVAIEGIMIMGAAVGFLAAEATGSLFYGVVGAVFAGLVFGIILAVFSVYLNASQLIVGLGLLVFGMGLSTLIYRIVIGVRLIAPQIPVLPIISIPYLSSIPYFGRILFEQNIMVYLAYIIVPVTTFVLYKTPIGLRVRACGENPRAADVLGINVFAVRFICTIIGSMFMGLAGAYLPMVMTGTFSDGMVGGRGWLALQIVIFGRWIPYQILIGSLFFAYVEALQFRFAMIMKEIPPQFFRMLPYILAIIVLVWVYKKAESPQSLMKPYDREQR